MVVKKGKEKVTKPRVRVTKPKVRTKVTVNIAEANKLFDKLADKLHNIHYGYTANPEMEELRKLFK